MNGLVCLRIDLRKLYNYEWVARVEGLPSLPGSFGYPTDLFERDNLSCNIGVSA